MTEKEFLKIRSQYDKYEDYRNPFISTKVKYFYLEKNERGALFETLYNQILLNYHRVLAECHICDDKLKLLGFEHKEPSATLLLRAERLQEEYFRLSYLLDLLDNETNFELVNWLYNDGNFRTDWEIKVRQCTFEFYSKKFQKKHNSYIATLVLCYLGGIGFFLWVPLLLSILGVIDALGYMFILAPFMPITTGIGGILALVSKYFIFTQEELEVMKIIEGNDDWKITASTAFTVKYSASQVGKALKSPWINK